MYSLWDIFKYLYKQIDHKYLLIFFLSNTIFEIFILPFINLNFTKSVNDNIKMAFVYLCLYSVFHIIQVYLDCQVWNYRKKYINRFYELFIKYCHNELRKSEFHYQNMLTGIEINQRIEISNTAYSLITYQLLYKSRSFYQFISSSWLIAVISWESILIFIIIYSSYFTIYGYKKYNKLIEHNEQIGKKSAKWNKQTNALMSDFIQQNINNSGEERTEIVVDGKNNLNNQYLIVKNAFYYYFFHFDIINRILITVCLLIFFIKHQYDLNKGPEAILLLHNLIFIGSASHQLFDLKGNIDRANNDHKIRGIQDILINAQKYFKHENKVSKLSENFKITIKNIEFKNVNY